MQNYLTIAVLALASFAAAAPAAESVNLEARDGVLTCGALQGTCTGPLYQCSCDALKQVSCINPPTFNCNLGCRCV